MASMKDSIFIFAKWINLHNMQNQYLSTFNSMVETNNQTKTMRDENWNDLIQRDNVSPEDPTQTDVFMDDEEWVKLYKEFRKTFRNLDARRDDLAENGRKDTLSFLDMVYGHGKCFGPIKTDDATVQLIETYILNNPDADVQAFFKQIAKSIGIEKPEDFFKDIRNKKYDAKQEIRDQLINFVQNIQYFKEGYSAFSISDDTANELRNKLSAFSTDGILTGLKDEADPTANDIDLMKNSYYPIMLRVLVEKKDVREDVSSAGGSKITSPIEKALDKTNYKDENGPDYVAPKEKDVLTPRQELEKSLKDWSNDTINKLKNRAMYDKYLLPDLSKPIALAVYGEKWEPADGMEKLLEITKGKLAGKFKGKQPHVAEALEFLNKALSYAKDKSQKQFEGALKNGNQGLAVDILIAEYGIREGVKDDIISAAHEVLSKMRWGYNTSVMRDKLFAEKVSLFGDKEYSWNKNEFMSNLTNALDTTLHYAAKGIFNIFNAGINAIRRNGRFYKLTPDEQARIDRINNENFQQKIDQESTIQSNLQSQLSQHQHDWDTKKTDFANWRNANGRYGRIQNDANKATIQAQRQQIDNNNALRVAQEQRFNTADVAAEPFRQQKQQLRQFRLDKENNKQNLNNRITQLNNDITQKNNRLAQLANNETQLRNQITNANNTRATLRRQQANMIKILRTARATGDKTAEIMATTEIQKCAKQIAAIDKKIDDITNNQIPAIINERNDINTVQIPAINTEINDITYNQIPATQAEIDNINNVRLPDVNNHLRPYISEIAAARREMQRLDNDNATIQATLAPIETLVNEYEVHTDGLRETMSHINQTREAIAQQEETLNRLENTDKNRFLSLMATRNMMNGQGGYVKNFNLASLFLASQKRIQQNFDNNADAIKQRYVQQFWNGHNVSIT